MEMVACFISCLNWGAGNWQGQCCWSIQSCILAKRTQQLGYLESKSNRMFRQLSLLFFHSSRVTDRAPNALIHASVSRTDSVMTVGLAASSGLIHYLCLLQLTLPSSPLLGRLGTLEPCSSLIGSYSASWLVSSSCCHAVVSSHPKLLHNLDLELL